MRTIFCDRNAKLQKISHLNFAVYYETIWADLKHCDIYDFIRKCSKRLFLSLKKFAYPLSQEYQEEKRQMKKVFS